MDKVVLIDGNNLMFRSYYATAYSGNLMKNSKGLPTNALYGFTNMINKIINEEKPKYVLVAFDKGKTFRHDNYHEYKAGRIAMPEELGTQFPIAKELLDSMGIKWFEIDGYEADDIIGTFASKIDSDKDFNGLIVSSDRDLLQLISDKVTVKLLKTKDYIMMDKNEFNNTYGIDPIKIIDLKGLMGDSSDNIPGVKGIGEKTALKLLQDYGSIENIYVNLDKITGKLKEKLSIDKDNAFMSKSLATIYKEVPINMDFNDIKYKGPDNSLKDLYNRLEFYSFIKNIDIKETKELEIKIIKDVSNIDLNNASMFIEVDNANYHIANVKGISFYKDNNYGFIPSEYIKDNIKYFSKSYTYDIKKNIVSLTKLGIDYKDYIFDSMIAGYLLNYNIKDDIAYFANTFNYNIKFSEEMYKKKDLTIDDIACEAIKKAKFIYETHNELLYKIEDECLNLYNDIELPLSFVLADMELTGIKVDKKVLDDMESEVTVKLDILKESIYNMAGCTFNINSPKQLGDVLFDKLGIPSNKKRSTDKEYLAKYKDNKVVEKILEYKALSKILNTYIVGLKDYILDDGKIHTIYNQALTRTGRLSSSYPNLQNIPTRYEYAKLIRKAFVPTNNYILSSDYSQIELRVLAHLSKVPKLIEAFNSGIDIHTKTAMEIFNVSESEVNSNMRRQAKAVNFGIIYGISGYGLSENLDININDAKKFIDKYFESFPGIKEYMESVVSDAKEKGYVKTIMNRKRNIDELKNTNYMIRQAGERIAENTPIQGSAADIIKKAMIDVYNRLKKENLESKMILQIHDELVFDVKESELKKLENIVKEVMEKTYKLDVPLLVDISYGINWLEAK